MTDVDYADDLLTNTPAQTEFMYFKQGAISTSNVKPLKSVDKFTYIGSNISSPESNVKHTSSKGVDCYL